MAHAGMAWPASPGVSGRENDFRESQATANPTHHFPKMSATSTETRAEGFRWPVRVYYEDTDAGGVVFNANYLRFMERARTERLRANGFELDQLQREHNLLFVVRSVEVDFLKPARFNDLLEVSADMAEIRAASLYFHQEVFRGGELLCRGKVRVVSVAAETFKPLAVPDWLAGKIREFAP
jgi:acyl-CoA thioester hydrolase